MNINKKIVALLVASVITLTGCNYNTYLITQNDSKSTEIFAVPNLSCSYVVKTKDSNIWYYAVSSDSGAITKYVIFGTVPSLNKDCPQTNIPNSTYTSNKIVELEKNR